MKPTSVRFWPGCGWRQAAPPTRSPPTACQDGGPPGQRIENPQVPVRVSSDPFLTIAGSAMPLPDMTFKMHATERDRVILSLLEEEGFVSFRELSRRLSLHPPPCRAIWTGCRATENSPASAV